MLRYVLGAIALTALLPFTAGAAPGDPFGLFTDPFTARPVAVDIDGDSILRDLQFDPTPGAPNSGDEGSRTTDIYGVLHVTPPSVGELVPFGLDCDISLDVGLGQGCLFPTAPGTVMNATAPLFGAPAIYDPNATYSLFGNGSTTTTDPFSLVPFADLSGFGGDGYGGPGDVLLDLGNDSFGVTGAPGFDARLSIVAGDVSPAPGYQELAQAGALYGVNPVRVQALGPDYTGAPLFGGLEDIQGVPGVFFPGAGGTDGPGGVDDGGFKGLYGYYAFNLATYPQADPNSVLYDPNAVPKTGAEITAAINYLTNVAGQLSEFSTPQQLAEIAATDLFAGNLGATVKSGSFGAAQYTPIGPCPIDTGAGCATITMKARAIRDFFRMAVIAGVTGDPFNPLDDIPSAGNDGIIPVDPAYEGGPTGPGLASWTDWVWTIDIATGTTVFTGTGAGWVTAKPATNNPISIRMYSQTFGGPWQANTVGIQNPLNGTLTPVGGMGDLPGIQSNAELGQSAVDFFCVNQASVPWVAQPSAPGSTYDPSLDLGATLTSPPNVVPGPLGVTAPLIDPTAGNPNQPCITMQTIPFDPETGVIVAQGPGALGVLYGPTSTFGQVNGFREVPEPGTALLLGIGLAGLALVRRRT